MIKKIVGLSFLKSLKTSHIIIFINYLAFLFFVYIQHDTFVDCKKELNYHDCMDTSGWVWAILWFLWIGIIAILITALIIEIGLKKFGKSKKSYDKETKEDNNTQDINYKANRFKQICNVAYDIYYFIGFLLTSTTIFLPLLSAIFYACISK